jgi:hypothetical protein
MEKLLYPLWKHPGDTAADLRERLLGPVAQGLVDAGAHAVRIAVADEAVAEAAGLRQVNSRPAFDALLSLWVDSSVWHRRFEAVFEPAVARFHGYLVCESEPIRHAARAPGDGSRVEGMCQVVFLQRPPRLARDEWLRIWQGSHTQVAIDTQATFGYRQNVVVRALGYAAPHYDAIVEENFPAAAMSSQQAFYGAVGDEAKYQRHLAAMIESCQRFIDFDRIDVIPTSEYNIAATR